MSRSTSNRFFTGWVLFCLLLSIYGYLADLILRFEIAADMPGILGAYLIVHFLTQWYIIGPVFLIYFLLSQRFENRILIKALYLMAAALLIERFVRPDDWNFVVGDYSDLKQAGIYALSALSVVLLDELYFKRKFRRSDTANKSR